MSQTHRSDRAPRAGIDPIRGDADALAVLALLAPFGHDTIALVLDAERRGSTVFVVTGTTDPDALFTVIDLCCSATSVDAHALVLASCRPGGSMDWSDAVRWADAALHCELAGVELVEWFVIGRHVERPRELAGDPPRWTVR